MCCLLQSNLHGNWCLVSYPLSVSLLMEVIWRLHHLQHSNRRCLSFSFWDTFTLRTYLSADPLPSRKKQKSTIACTCLSRTINSAKWTNSSTLQRILTGSSNPDWKQESAWRVQDCETTPEYPLNQSTRLASDIFLIHYGKRGTQSLRMPIEYL